MNEKNNEYNIATGTLFGAHFILRVDKILMKEKYYNAIIYVVKAKDFPQVPVIMVLAASMVYTSNMIFVIIMVVSVLVLDVCLCLISVRRKSKVSFAAFVLAFFGTMMRGYWKFGCY